MIKLKSLLENIDDGYYYHITLAPFAPAIQTDGLKIRGRKSTITNYREYSKGKTFLCDINSLNCWIEKIKQHGFHGYDDEKYHDVAIFKVAKDALKDVQIDKVGDEDCRRGGSYYVTYDIPANLIEFVKEIVNYD